MGEYVLAKKSVLSIFRLLQKIGNTLIFVIRGEERVFISSMARAVNVLVM